MKIKYAILVCFFGLFCCKNSDDVSSLSIENKMVVEEIVNNMVNNLKIQDESYLIDPVFNKFEFNSYTHNYRNEIPEDKNKAILLAKHEWDENEFEKIKNEVNQKYFDKVNEGLSNYSKGQKANWVIKFSGFYEKFIFVEAINLCEKVTKEQLLNGLEIEKKPKWEVFSIVYELKENKIDNKLVDNIIIHELPCGNTDVTLIHEATHSKKN